MMICVTDAAVNHPPFADINRAYRTVFRPGRLSLGLVVPIEAYPNSPVPTLERHIERVRLAEDLGFGAVWLRDVPFNVPSFGDAGQTFDPFVYLGMLAATTRTIALGVASVILPLRHPAHVAKAAASADTLSGGRLLLGIASGDRPEEYPALSQPFPKRGERFRQSLEYLRAAAQSFPQFENELGTMSGDIDMLPKPHGGRIPVLITGGSQQSPDWVATHGDGWMTYPRGPEAQRRIVSEYRERIEASSTANKPVMQSLYVDLEANPDADPSPIHLGFRSGVHFLEQYLANLESYGINHVAINLRLNSDDVESTMRRLADYLLPRFSTAPTQ